MPSGCRSVAVDPLCAERAGSMTHGTVSSKVGVNHCGRARCSQGNGVDGIMMADITKICIVTGGSSGIGEATVRLAQRRGYRVYNLDVLPPPPASSLRDDTFIKCDVTNHGEVEEVVKAIAHREAGIDALVISAGVHLSANIEQTSEDDFDRVMSVNAKGTYCLLKSVIPLMKEKRKGSIVIVSSDQAFIGKKNSFAYNSSKAAIAAMARTIALDYAPFGIRCNAVCPGTIDTPLYQNAVQRYASRHGLEPDAVHQEEAQEQPLGRIGTPEDVANFIDFLIGDTSSFITGALLPIDGGYTAR